MNTMTSSKTALQARLSVVVPVLDEEHTLQSLHSELEQALNGRYDYEVIFVDDGSTDGSLEVLERLSHQDPRVQVIRFRGNFGQTAALSAGFAHARGDVVVALDADLQNDPSDIPRLVETLAEGYDVVSGWRRQRQDSALTRRLPSRAANWLISSPLNIRFWEPLRMSTRPSARLCNSILRLTWMLIKTPWSVSIACHWVAIGGRQSEAAVRNAPSASSSQIVSA